MAISNLKSQALAVAQKANQTEFFLGGKIAPDAFLKAIQSGTVSQELVDQADAAAKESTFQYFGLNHVRIYGPEGEALFKKLSTATDVAFDLLEKTKALLAKQTAASVGQHLEAASAE